MLKDVSRNCTDWHVASAGFKIIMTSIKLMRSLTVIRPAAGNSISLDKELTCTILLRRSGLIRRMDLHAL